MSSPSEQQTDADAARERYSLDEIAATSAPLMPAVEGVRKGPSLEARAKFIWPPFRAGWKLRSRRYARSKSRELGLLPFLVPRDRIAIDIGASVGLVTYFLARLAPRVVAFEPSPVPLEILTRVVDDNVMVCPVGVSSKSGAGHLDVFSTSSGWTMNGASLSPDDTARRRSVRVPIRTFALDDIDLGDVGFIKIDVEGHEADVLEGAAATIRANRPVLMIENEVAHVGDRIGGVFEALTALDYTVLGLKDDVLTDRRTFDVAAFQQRTRGDRARYLQNFVAIPSA